VCVCVDKSVSSSIMIAEDEVSKPVAGAEKAADEDGPDGLMAKDASSSLLSRLSRVTIGKEDSGNAPMTPPPAAASRRVSGGAVGWADIDDSPLATVKSGRDSAGGRHSNNHSRPRSRPQSRPQSRGKEIRFPSPIAPKITTRPLSRKKERRWVNANRAGVDAYIPGWDLAEEEFDVLAASRLIFARDHPSLFEGMSPAMLEAFSSCEAGFFAPANSDLKRKEHMASTPLECFLRIDKKLRRHLLDTSSREPFATFIAELEQVLCDVFFRAVSSENLVVGEHVESALLQPLRVSVGENGEPEVALHFRNPLHRLLAHGVSQFHALVSQSHSVQGKKGQRVLKIQGSTANPATDEWVDVEFERAHLNEEKGAAQLRGAEYQLLPVLLKLNSSN